MLNIKDSLSGAAAKRYFQDQLSAADYFLEDAAVVGRWRGLGAARLGLFGQVSRDAFFALIDNRQPDGSKLTARTKATRRPGTDFTFTAPKSVSLLYELGGDERVREAFERACDDTMDEIERDIRTRVRKAGAQADRVTGEGTWACFTHRTARPVDGVPDPHLHVHAYLINATYDGEERGWKAAEIGPIKRDAPYYEAAFHARLAHRLVALGYPIARKGQVFDVAGVPEALLRRFSRREAQVAAAAQALGAEGRAAQALSTTTRSAKAGGERIGTLQGIWYSWLPTRERAALDGLIKRARLGPARGEPITAQGALAYARAHVFERLSVVDRSRLLTEALRRGFGALLPEGVQLCAQRSPELIGRRIDGRDVVTDQRTLANEEAMLARAKDGRGRCRVLGDRLAPVLPPFLNGNQRAVIDQVLASRDRVIALRGGAGTGKTTVLKAIAEGIHAAGKPIVAVAPTASAARDVLRKEGFSSAETAAKLLRDRALQSELQGGVLLVDEAGLLGVQDMDALLALAEQRDARVLLVGDPRQHGSVSAGDALRLLTRYAVEPAELTEIVRQRGTYREAVASVESGAVARGFSLLADLDALHEAPGEMRLIAAADAYLEAVRSGRSALLVSPTHREKDALVERVRDGLRADGRLGAAQHRVERLVDLRFSEAQKQDAASYRVGQVVVFRQHAKGSALKRGERARVCDVGFDGSVQVARADGSVAALPLDQGKKFSVFSVEHLNVARGELIRVTANGISADGRRLNNGAIFTVTGFTRSGDLKLSTGGVLDRTFGHVDYGYASTSHSAQGRTVDEVVIAMGRESTPASFYEQFYVTLSRGRHGVQLYTDDLAGVQRAVAQSRARGSAHELMQGALASDLRPMGEGELRRSRHRKIQRQRTSELGAGGAISHYALQREGVYAEDEYTR